jgi:hypothetical protein
MLNNGELKMLAQDKTSTVVNFFGVVALINNIEADETPQCCCAKNRIFG